MPKKYSKNNRKLPTFFYKHDKDNDGFTFGIFTLYLLTEIITLQKLNI